MDVDPLVTQRQNRNTHAGKSAGRFAPGSQDQSNACLDRAVIGFAPSLIWSFRIRLVARLAVAPIAVRGFPLHGVDRILREGGTMEPTRLPRLVYPSALRWAVALFRSLVRRSGFPFTALVRRPAAFGSKSDRVC